MRYFQRERIDWINETILIFGYINRDHVCKKFGVSIPQASKDMQLAMFLNPRIMRYDTHSKKYILAKGEDPMEDLETLIDLHAARAQLVCERRNALDVEPSEANFDLYLKAVEDLDVEHKKLKQAISVSGKMSGSPDEPEKAGDAEGEDA